MSAVNPHNTDKKLLTNQNISTLLHLINLKGLENGMFSLIARGNHSQRTEKSTNLVGNYNYNKELRHCMGNLKKKKPRHTIPFDLLYPRPFLYLLGLLLPFFELSYLSNLLRLNSSQEIVLKCANVENAVINT